MRIILIDQILIFNEMYINIETNYDRSFHYRLKSIDRSDDDCIIIYLYEWIDNSSINLIWLTSLLCFMFIIIIVVVVVVNLFEEKKI